VKVLPGGRSGGEFSQRMRGVPCVATVRTFDPESRVSGFGVPSAQHAR
jgi:hypothetical protein